MKKNIILHLVLILSFISIIKGQDCLPEGITFSTQKEIDNFLTDYPDCTNIKGDLRIKEKDAKNITNLNSLSQITSIEGKLILSINTDLTSLAGLNNLTTIGGDFGMWGNSSLKNLNGLDNLISINGNLTISKNNSLLNLDGLNNLTSIGGYLRVIENNYLKSLSGLDFLISIGKDLWVEKNDHLKNVNGLENLTTIMENLIITQNKTLVDLNGLKTLTYVGKSIKVIRNDSLISPNSLSNISSIGGKVIVSNNASLTNENEPDKLSLKRVKKRMNLNEKEKPAFGDSKWELGAEVGISSVNLEQSTTESFIPGFRVGGNIKYNINGRFQIIGGIGLVKSNRNRSLATESKDIMGNYLFDTSFSIITTIKSDIIEKYTLLEIPVYLRWHLFEENLDVSDKFNFFFDLGGRFIIPVTNESSFTQGINITTRTSSFRLFGPDLNTSTSTSSYQEGKLEFQNRFNTYIAVGFLIGKRISIAYTSSRIVTHAVKDEKLRYKSNLKSITVSVFF